MCTVADFFYYKEQDFFWKLRNTSLILYSTVEYIQ